MFSYLISQLKRYSLAYLHVTEPLISRNISSMELYTEFDSQ
jgi:hypothetical protein